MAVNRRQVAVRKRTSSDRFIPVIPSVTSFKLHGGVGGKVGDNSSQSEEQRDHWDAIAEALEFRPLNKVLQYSLNSQRHFLSTSGLEGSLKSRKTSKPKKAKKIRNSVPYRSLDAPGLLNDYYCTLIAWSTVSGHLAVGLGSQVFLWTEYDGSRVLPLPDDYGPVSCLAFSCSNILAVGRKDGSITCYDVNNSSTKSIYVHVDAAVCCAAWLPQSETELFVGDEIGNVMLLRTDEGDCSMYRSSVLKCHTQQICGVI
jgi:WD40 repeat protein